MEVGPFLFSDKWRDNYCAKHANARGSGGMPSQEILKITCSENEFGDISELIIVTIWMYKECILKPFMSTDLLNSKDEA